MVVIVYGKPVNYLSFLTFLSYNVKTEY
jgi:hypothetical protein